MTATTTGVLAAEGGTVEVEVSPTPDLEFDSPDDLGEATNVLVDSIEGLVEGLVRSLPLIVIGLLILVVGVLLARAVGRGTERALRRAGGDQVVVNLGARLVRLAVVVAAVLLALSVAGVPVGAALAGLGLAGLAIAFALQSILENFVAGVILILRKPISHGEQVIVGAHEGTVDDIDLRVTRLVDYDGELIIIPNAEVFRATLVNLTRRGKRRTRVVVGIDYRDDDAAARDGVLRGVKTAIEGAGMSIPWPIRTLSFDNALTHAGADGP